jgi:hypothetical protein
MTYRSETTENRLRVIEDPKELLELLNSNVEYSDRLLFAPTINIFRSWGRSSIIGRSVFEEIPGLPFEEI